MISSSQTDALELAAISWCGTPFCEGSPVKGAGASCHHVCAESYFESGLISPRIPIPNGPSNWRAQPRSLIREWVESSGLFLTIAEGTTPGEGANKKFIAADARLACTGDLLGFRVGALHHAMLQLSRGRVLHAVVGHGAGIAEQIPTTWALRLDAIWRLKILA